MNQTRSLTHKSEFQWFAHDLGPEIFTGGISETLVEKLGEYFIERVNPALVSPYSIRFENPPIKEPYKFVSGSLEKFKEVLTWARFVCEALKGERDPNGKIWVSPHVTINCGNLKDAPTFEHSTETFISQVGALAVKETLLTPFCAKVTGVAPAVNVMTGNGEINTGYFLILNKKIKTFPFG